MTPVRIAAAFSILVACAAFKAPAVAEESATPVRQYFHHPAVNAGAREIAFCYQGDIWISDREGKTVRRLTDHKAYDTRPIFSPTSNQIAFSSDREGGMDVYVVPVTGGKPRRLTFHSAGDNAIGFTPFGNAVVFLSRRNTRRHRVYSIPLSGGEPAVLLEAPASHVSFSPDGGSIAFTLGAMAWWRRGYRGAGNLDVWIKALDGSKAEKATSWEGNDTDVLWGKDGFLYFVSDRIGRVNRISDMRGVGNLWKMNPGAPSEVTQLTSNKRHPVLTPSLSPDAKWLVYTDLEEGIRLFDMETGESRRVPLRVVTDEKENPILRETFTDKAAEMAVSPDGKEIAFAVRGDIFVVKKKGGDARKITESPAREGSPVWMPDGKSLLFVSDRAGNNDILRVRSDEEGRWRLSRARFFKTEVLVSSSAREESPVVSPDGKSFLYLEGLGDLRLVSLGEGESSTGWSPAKAVRLVARGPLIHDAVWSPDSRWIAFSKSEKDWNDEIYIQAASGGDPVNVTRDPDDDSRPRFDPKGEYLYFTSSRGGGERFNIFRIPLTLKIEQKDKKEEEEDEEDEEEDDEEDEDDDEDAEDGKGKKKKKRGKEEEPVEVKIDFEKIEDRAKQVTSTRGNDTLPVLADDGKTLFFKSNSLGFFEIWKSAADGSSLTRLTQSRHDPEEMVWSRKGKELIYRTGGTLRTLSADGKRKGTVPYRARMKIDLRVERREAFEEAWRALKDFFYDPDMHGADWERCRKEYWTWAGGCAATEDFNDIFRMMLGELNASHLGIYGPKSGRKPEKTGFTGIEFKPGPAGKRYKAHRILKNSPADREDSKVKPGEFLAAVNRREVKAGDNLSALFNGTVGEKVDLLLAPGEEGAGGRTVTLRPIDPGEVGSLLYEAWVEEKRARVIELSGGRLGYIHIRWMSRGQFGKFRREYLAKVREKEGLILDVRNNPGGYIHNELWELLSKRRPVGRFRIRGAGEEVQPDHTWEKPVVLLINERSASDAEIFPWGFQRLGIGKVIGVPTWGGVIGTGGTSLINGAWLRLPFVGWYTAEGKNLENFGVAPDIHVENHPEDDATGAADKQLEKAVEIVLAEIGKK